MIGIKAEDDKHAQFELQFSSFDENLANLEKKQSYLINDVEKIHKLADKLS